DTKRSESTTLFRVIFEDDHLVVLDKPAGLLVLPDRYDPALANLYDLLKTKYGQIYVVHRIDKGTSGLILFAKTETAHASLNRQFEERATEKEYVAICVGESSKESGKIDLPLSESPGKRFRMRVDRDKGKESVTNYKVLEQFREYTFLAAKPETGRTHQIRVHLSAINLPILGDAVYGGGDCFLLSRVKPGYRVKGEEKPLLDRTALHASRIIFEHPGTQEKVTLEAELPKDMKIVLNYLRKFRAHSQ
ncbi:MAG TPA: RluA family pseudouridine synthase, partial [Bacteroidota bacterium]